jgi:lipopolysaccharide transport system permease protein
MISYPISPTSIITSMRSHRELLMQLALRDAFGRYRTSYLGAVWSVLAPLTTLMVYTFVFGKVLPSNWSGSQAGVSTKDFAIVLFAGLLVFNYFAECVTRAPSVILNNPNYVTKVVFPLEILVPATMLSALVHLLANALLLLLFQAILVGHFSIFALLLPVALLPLFFLTLGVMWFLASLGVYVRDVGQFAAIVVTPLLFLSPIFFPMEAVPIDYRWLMKLSPLTGAVEAARDVLVFDRLPDVSYWLANFGASVAVMTAGFAWFQYTRSGFADVL